MAIFTHDKNVPTQGFMVSKLKDMLYTVCLGPWREGEAALQTHSFIDAEPKPVIHKIK